MDLSFERQGRVKGYPKATDLWNSGKLSRVAGSEARLQSQLNKWGKDSSQSKCCSRSFEANGSEKIAGQRGWVRAS